MAALAKIPRSHREVLLLIAWGGLSSEEAAEALGLTGAAVRTRLHRARKTLRASLNGAEPTTIGKDG